MKKLSMWVAVILLCTSASAFAEFEMTPDVDPSMPEETYFSFSDPEEEQPSIDPAFAPTEHPVEEPIWTYPIPRELLDDPLDVIVLANRDNLLSSDYPPEDDIHEMVKPGVKLTKANNEMRVRAIANDAMVSMFAAAEADGMTLLLHSAYRSHRTQSVMYENRLKDKGRDDGYVTPGGASDHQTGLGVDIVNPEWAKKSGFNAEFAKTAEAQWMAEHCTEYGFVIRYPEGKKDITTIEFEPWHLRYVGVEVATYMTENGLTLEEFTEEWQAAVALFESVENGEVVVNSFSF